MPSALVSVILVVMMARGPSVVSVMASPETGLAGFGDGVGDFGSGVVGDGGGEGVVGGVRVGVVGGRRP